MVSDAWSEKNRKYLTASLNRVKLLLQEYASHEKPDRRSEPAGTQPWDEKDPPAVEGLKVLFGLSGFETDILLLCAGVELDSRVARLCATSQGSPNSPHPTFGLALAALPNAHWSALAPTSPLRRFHLVDLAPQSSTLTTTPLRIAERVLHYLTGISYLDPELAGLLHPMRGDTPLVRSHELLADRVLLSYNRDRRRMPVVQLWGSDDPSKQAVARTVSSRLGLELWQMDGERIPSKNDEVERLAGLWTREAALLCSGLYISAEDVEPMAQKVIRRMIAQLPGPVFIGTRDRLSLLDSTQTLSMEVKKPEKSEQRELWREALDSHAQVPDEEGISRLTSQFNLNADSIGIACAEASAAPAGEGTNFHEALWAACLGVSRPRLSELAQQIVPRARMDDLVIPDDARGLLKEIAIQVAHRQKVYEEWGFEERSARGLGITTLFSGASGTGKTMAAEVLANELHLDLFRIDIATVVSKYIGETEKNLRKVFDAAEDGGAILFFDEADALFGKRSEVRDSHDRYANIEISYLLQRMENYRGLAILSTNMKDALDPAFTRRIRFMVEFPFPDQHSRAEIWRRIFPPSTPIDSIDIEHLARLNVAGGNIRNIALYASFLAADEGVSVNMKHLKRATQVEYEKLERPLTQAELGNWVWKSTSS